MKIGARGQVTIPKEFRERLGLNPSAEVEFSIERGELILRRKTARPRPALDKWTGFLQGQPEDIDEFIEEIRGR